MFGYLVQRLNIKKCDSWNGTTQTDTILGDCVWDKNTPDSELVQIKKYGGFYIARYEAGLANTIKEFTTNQNTYVFKLCIQQRWSTLKVKLVWYHGCI